MIVTQLSAKTRDDQNRRQYDLKESFRQVVSKNIFWNDQDVLHAPDIISTSTYTMVSKT